jgi:hypothetical protein
MSDFHPDNELQALLQYDDYGGVPKVLRTMSIADDEIKNC